MGTVVTMEHTIKITERRTTDSPELLLPPDARGRRLCALIEQEIGRITRYGDTQLKAVLIGSGSIKKVAAKDGIVGNTGNARKQELHGTPRNREAGYHGKKRWMVQHMKKGIRVIYARSGEMAICTAALDWGFSPADTAERAKMWVKPIKEQL